MTLIVKPFLHNHLQTLTSTMKYQTCKSEHHQRTYDTMMVNHLYIHIDKSNGPKIGTPENKNEKKSIDRVNRFRKIK